MMRVLLRNGPRHRTELWRCLLDNLAPTRNIAAHLTSIRKKIRPLGYDVAHQVIDGEAHYRLVQMVDVVPEVSEVVSSTDTLLDE